MTIDQFRKTVGADLKYAWFPVERPTVVVSAAHNGMNVLGALTEVGETLFLECNGSFTKEVTIQFRQVLHAEVGEKLVVFLYRSSYSVLPEQENLRD